MPSHPTDLRSFGRRRGRKASPRQATLLATALPRLAIGLQDAPPGQLGDLFGPPVAEVWLEIGFGGGEHLLWQAGHNPGVGLIGCEPFQDGVVKVLSALAEHDIANVRLHADDARPLLRWLPGASIGRAFMLFPDPWPKTRHQKRRLVSQATLAEFARVLVAGGELRVATDIASYARAILLAVRAEGSFAWTAQSPADWRCRPADWPPTRYEEKALREGRRCSYFRFRSAADPRSGSASPTGLPDRATIRLQSAQGVHIIPSLMIIATSRVGPSGPLFLFCENAWAFQFDLNHQLNRRAVRP